MDQTGANDTTGTSSPVADQQESAYSGPSGGQILFNITENITESDGATSSSGIDKVDFQPVMIKQEITGETMEIADLVAAVSGEHGGEEPEEIGQPLSYEELVDYHNDVLKQHEDEVGYLTKCFEVMYRFKSVFDLVLDDYFKLDPHFKYRNVLDDLELDLCTIIGDNEEKYQGLLSEINTDVVYTEDDQIEFADGGGPHSDNENDDLNNIDCGNRLVQIVNGVEVFNSSIRKLPGQKTAEPPECPACGYKARCRLKLEAHILEHVENPLVVCNHDGCEMPFEIHRLFQHEKDYHPEVNLTCEMCNEMFESKTMLIQHYKLHIKRKEKLRCHLCDYTDIYIGRMDRHKQNVHGLTITKQFKCDYEGCGRVFKDRPSFYTHSMIHKDRSLVYKHKCSIDSCDAVFKRRRNLMMHMLKHGTSRKRFSCNISNCKRTYSRERELQRHIELCHRAGVIHLDDPNSKYYVEGGVSIKKEFDEADDSIELVDHSKDDEGDTTGNSEFDHTNATGEVTGEDGNIIYVNDSNVTTVNVISCDGMDVDGNETSGQITEHVIEMDENGNATNGSKMILVLNKGADGEQLELVSNGNIVSEILGDDTTLTDECELCNVKFPTSADMISHLKERHHQYTIRAYRCDFDACTFATHFRSILGKHKNTIHGGKYKCEVCGKLSKDSGNHNRHRNIHKNVVFRCRYENCDAVYKSPKAYYVHVLTHSNEQPVYRCDYPNCKYVTYYMNTLNVHKLTHSDVRNFFCPYEQCGKGFKRNGDLNKHITHSHKGVKRPQKKRKLNENSQLMYRCTWTNCQFTAMDNDTLNKHEEEHAATSVEKYKFEVVDDEE